MILELKILLTCLLLIIQTKSFQSSAQSIALIKNLPLLIGDKIPEDDNNWYSVLVLIKICQTALSPVHSFPALKGLS